MTAETFSYLPQLQEQRFLQPYLDVYEDYDAVYNRNEISVGWPAGALRRDAHLARPGSELVIGIALGDEGKGRIVDNKLEALLNLPGVTLAYVDRFNGGSNAGHTVEKDEIKLKLSQVPSGVLYPEVIGIMDRGMVIHSEDLQTEIEFIEQQVGDTRKKLILSEEAILVTDLERAEEILNRIRQGKAAGGTGRGIGPSYGHRLDRRGHLIYELLDDKWRETIGDAYDQYVKDFAAYGLDLADISVPDYKQSRLQNKQITRKVGPREEFLDRLEEARTWILERNMVRNTYLIHHKNLTDFSTVHLFEAGQAVGLHPFLGTYPDTTSSDTTAFGIQTGTGIWKVENVRGRIGVFKATYTSSVGARQMPTEIPLAKSVLRESDLGPAATPQQRRAAYIRDYAQEKGTVTQRPRDILELDLAMLAYNARMGGIEEMAATHLDCARKGEDIRVCTHYTDSQGNYVPYQPSLRYQENVIPFTINLSGWDGEVVKNAKSFNELPENAIKYLAFIQRRTGFPIVTATTGPKREHYLDIPPFPPQGTIYSGIGSRN